MRPTEHYFDAAVWLAVFCVAGYVGGAWGLATAGLVSLYMVVTG